MSRVAREEAAKVVSEVRDLADAYVDAMGRIDALESELAELRSGQEPAEDIGAKPAGVLAAGAKLSICARCHGSGIIRTGQYVGGIRLREDDRAGVRELTFPCPDCKEAAPDAAR